MKNIKFRELTAQDIECRVQQVKANGLVLLLYKDARCDMRILDEAVGNMRWKREHSRDNANCTISIYDEDLGMWISKEDTGTESNTEAEKGLASDSFKRAGTNWGIGRSLYTAPFIWVSADKCTINNGKCYDKFEVESIEIDDGVIKALTIRNTTANLIAYTMRNASSKQTRAETNNTAQNTQNQAQKADFILCSECLKPIEAFTGKNGKEYSAQWLADYTIATYSRCLCLNCKTKFDNKQKELKNE